jgi:DNA topoisomerase I
MPANKNRHDSEIAHVIKKNKLRFVNDNEPGYQRLKKGRRFLYLDSNGIIIKDVKRKKRFKSLVIPPAWTNVWICKSKNGHIQVTGRDVKGKKQYIYHERWNELSNENKFSRLLDFGEKLPGLKTKIEGDLRKHSMDKEKVLAVIVKLLNETFIRIGNSVYAKKNKSFGLTTLKNRHINTNGSAIKIKFSGKSGKNWDVDIKDKRIIKLILQCQELPGQRLFTYLDEEGKHQSIESSDVNHYLQENMGEDFTAKDFRTWGGTVLTTEELLSAGKVENDEYEKTIKQVIKNVSKKLFNTVAICKKYYIHPSVLEAYRKNKLFTEFKKNRTEIKKKKYKSYSLYELIVLNILRKSTN